MQKTEWIRLGIEFFKTILILLGGLYALYEYRRFRRFRAKAQLDLDFDVLPLPHSPDFYMVDIRPQIKNLGQVRQKFPKIELWINGLKDSDIPTAQAGNRKVRFTDRLFRDPNIVQDPTDPYFIDPGVTQLFPYQALITGAPDYVMVAIRFYYRVPFLTYLYLKVRMPMRLRDKVRHLQLAEQDRDNKKVKKLSKEIDRLEGKIRRLNEFRVNEYHMTSKIKALRAGSNT